jgi:protein KRI1
VKRFPRTIEDSLRREDERRKKQRETTKERKKDEKERQKEEVQRLKAYKRKEIMEKLQQLQEISGNADLPLEDLDIEGDFDPDEYDKKMGKVFNEEYYKDDVDGEKPEFPHDPEIDDGGMQKLKLWFFIKKLITY